ncbi:MAG TPA: hypothetical protein VHC49_23250 [Mycobacteriales bacterium]|nr:hypothetical protein [Mycobacteriales bacterium]
MDVIWPLVLAVALAAAVSLAGTFWGRDARLQYKHWFAVGLKDTPVVAQECRLNAADMQLISVGNGILRWRYVVNGDVRHYVVLNGKTGKRTCIAPAESES